MEYPKSNITLCLKSREAVARFVSEWLKYLEHGSALTMTITLLKSEGFSVTFAIEGSLEGTEMLSFLNEQVNTSLKVRDYSYLNHDGSPVESGSD